MPRRLCRRVDPGLRRPQLQAAPHHGDYLVAEPLIGVILNHPQRRPDGVVGGSTGDCHTAVPAPATNC